MQLVNSVLYRQQRESIQLGMESIPAEASSNKRFTTAFLFVFQLNGISIRFIRVVIDVILFFIFVSTAKTYIVNNCILDIVIPTR